ncbi:MAG: hypothetical protein LBB74_05870 [Chitinispirillales bacterium]|jgi:uncharacterized protein (TIGR02145 family)|nr:hypothetical protein [Chitinispirillales bacterium]
MWFFNRRVCVLMLAVAVGAVCLWGCGDDGGNPGGNNGSGNYKSVRIGAKTWMAENLNISTANSWCYDNDNSNCVKYGRLYTWEAAKTACPAGWHLPTKANWDDLVTAAGGESFAGKKLKAKSGWGWNYDDDVSGNGTDVYGFSALPGGRRDADGGFHGAGAGGSWWTATGFEYKYGDRDGAYFRDMSSYEDHAIDKVAVLEYGFSVRCVGD